MLGRQQDDGEVSPGAGLQGLLLVLVQELRVATELLQEDHVAGREAQFRERDPLEEVLDAGDQLLAVQVQQVGQVLSDRLSEDGRERKVTAGRPRVPLRQHFVWHTGYHLSI